MPNKYFNFFLKNSNEKKRIKRKSILNAIIMSSPTAIIVIDTQSIIVEWSDKSEILFGWNKIDVIGKKLTDVVIPFQYRQKHIDGITRYLKTNKSSLIGNKSAIEINALHKNGHLLPIKLILNESLAHSGEKLFIGFIEDISDEVEKKNTIKIMEQTTNTLNLFLMSVPSPISVFDKNINCIFKNNAFKSINYCNCQTCNCKCTHNILNYMALLDKIKNVLNSGICCNLKSQCYHFNNTYYDIDIIRAIFDNKCLILVYFINVTDVVNNNIKNNNNSKFKENNILLNYQIKFDFLNKLGNIIYSNTSAINNYIQIYKNNNQNNNTILDNIYSHNNYLYSISCKINNIFDLNNSYKNYHNFNCFNNNDSFYYKLKPNEFHIIKINDIVDYIYSYYTTIAEKKNILFTLDLSLDLKDTYKIQYGSKIINILKELLDNSFKFSSIRSTITLSIYNFDTYLNIIVNDTGIGIEEQYLDNILEPFFKINKNDTNSFGLGLYIVHSIILILQGNVNIDSTFGEGTRISVNIPIHSK